MHTLPPVVTSSRCRTVSRVHLHWAILAVFYFTAFQARALGQQFSSSPQKEQISCTAEGYLRIALFPIGRQSKTPVAVVMTDPQGRKLGYDPIGKVEYADVPEATFSGDKGETAPPPRRMTQEEQESGVAAITPPTPSPTSPAPAVLELCNPVGGQYQLRVIGTQQGKYGLSINAANREIVDVTGRLLALDSRAEIPPTNARKGAAQNFLVVYSRTPGVKVRVKSTP
jgi:hypothetical protein